MAHASALRLSRPLAILSLIALCLPLAGCGINTIPTYEQNAKAAWSEDKARIHLPASATPNMRRMHVSPMSSASPKRSPNAASKRLEKSYMLAF